MILGVVLAGGVGLRMNNGSIPKQFIDLCGKPIIIHTIERMLEVEEFDYIYIAIHPEYQEYLQEILKKFNLEDNQKLIIIHGGKNRLDSVRNFINSAYELNHDENDILIIHEAVRPFVSVKTLKNAITLTQQYGATIATTQAVDTILISNDGISLDASPDRKTVFNGQAPDSFKLGILKKFIEELTEEEYKYVTGTIQIAYLKGYPVKIFEGDIENFKITVEQDLLLAEKIYLQQEAKKCK